MSKKILITGVHSYIGNSFCDWCTQNHTDWEYIKISLRGSAWKQLSFRGYDAILHVAGIAHADVGRASEEEQEEYYRINTDLTEQCAQKAKEEGVPYFIFMSSIIVYGESARIGMQKIITKETVPIPDNFYGDSKLQAERRLLMLGSEDFKLAIVRPPMVYGKGAKGNYRMLSKFVRKTCLFPDIYNARSMIYIENLCDFLGGLIERKAVGIFFPQNAEYVQTSQMVKLMGDMQGKKIYLTKIFNPLICLASKFPKGVGKLVNKVFGNLVYAQELSRLDFNYCRVDFKESIYRAEEEM